MSGISASLSKAHSGGFSDAFSAPRPPALAPLLLVKRRAIDLCRVDSCLCRRS